MARTFAVTYGTYVIGLSGTDSEVRLTDKIRMDQDYEGVSVSFEVIVLGSSAANFLTVEADLVAAYTKPDQALLIAVGGSTRYTWSQSSNTGFNAQPSIEKLAGDEDTDRSSRYRLSVSLGLPADLSGKDGRQSSSVGVSFDASGIRTVTVSGVYTALASNSARAQFEASIAAYVATVKSALSVTTWELVGRPTEEDDDNGKLLRFSRVYQEVIKAQSTAGGDHSAIVNPSLKIRRADNATNDTLELGQTEAMTNLSVDYYCSVDHSVTTDLDTLYTGTIRPYIIQEAETLAGGAVAVLDEKPAFDAFRNRVSVSMSLRADTGSGLYAATVETQEIISSGEIRYVVWNGDPFARDIYQGPRTHIYRLRKSVLRRKGSGGSLASEPPTADFRENSLVRKVQRRSIGKTSDSTFDVEFIVMSQEFERAGSALPQLGAIDQVRDIIGTPATFGQGF